MTAAGDVWVVFDSTEPDADILAVCDRMEVAVEAIQSSIAYALEDGMITLEYSDTLLIEGTVAGDDRKWRASKFSILTP